MKKKIYALLISATILIGGLVYYSYAQNRKVLDLSHHRLYSIGIIPDYVEELDLSFNELNNITSIDLPKGLKKINLSNNRLEEIPFLAHLALEEIEITSNLIPLQADSLHRLINPNLKKLIFTRNLTSGTVRIIDSRLESINLSSNHIRGFYSNTTIKDINLSKNQLVNFYFPIENSKKINLTNNYNLAKENTLSYHWLIDKPTNKLKIKTDIILDSITYNNAVSSHINSYKKNTANKSKIAYSKDSIHFGITGTWFNTPIRLQVYRNNHVFYASYTQKEKPFLLYTSTWDSVKNSITLQANNDNSYIQILLDTNKKITSVIKDGQAIKTISPIVMGNSAIANINYCQLYASKQLLTNTKLKTFIRNYIYPQICTNNKIVDNKINLTIEQLTLSNATSFFSMEDAGNTLPQLFQPRLQEYITNSLPLADQVKVSVLKNEHSILTIQLHNQLITALDSPDQVYSTIYSFNLHTGDFLRYTDIIKDLSKKEIIDKIHTRLALKTASIPNVKKSHILLKDRISTYDTSLVFYVVLNNKGNIKTEEVTISMEELVD